MFGAKFIDLALQGGVFQPVSQAHPSVQSLDFSRTLKAFFVQALITLLPAIERGDGLPDLQVVLRAEGKGKLCLLPLEKQAILKKALQKLFAFAQFLATKHLTICMVMSAPTRKLVLVQKTLQSRQNAWVHLLQPQSQSMFASNRNGPLSIKQARKARPRAVGQLDGRMQLLLQCLELLLYGVPTLPRIAISSCACFTDGMLCRAAAAPCILGPETLHCRLALRDPVAVFMA